MSQLAQALDQQRAGDQDEAEHRQIEAVLEEGIEGDERRLRRQGDEEPGAGPRRFPPRPALRRLRAHGVDR